MSRKKETKNNNAVLLIIAIVAIIAAGVFTWINRYEFFPQLIKDGVSVYFLTQNGEDKEIRFKYDENHPKTRFNYAITKLIEGPTGFQKLMNVYSEIPTGTKVIAILEGEDKNIIDLTSDFNTGGGTESIHSKLHQLINTVEANTSKPTYLFINSVQTEVFGGEGIMITQPLSKNSL